MVREGVVDGGKRRPGEVGARAEAADVGLRLHRQLFRQVKEGARADQRVHPAEALAIAARQAEGADRHVVGDLPEAHAAKRVQGELRGIDEAVAALQGGHELFGIDASIDDRAGRHGNRQRRQRAGGMAFGGVHIHGVAREDEAVVAAPHIDEPAEVEIAQDVGERFLDADRRAVPERRDVSLQPRRPHVGRDLHRPARTLGRHRRRLHGLAGHDVGGIDGLGAAQGHGNGKSISVQDVFPQAASVFLWMRPSFMTSFIVRSGSAIREMSSSGLPSITRMSA